MSESPNRDLPGGRPSLRHRPQYLLEWPLRPWWRALLVLLAVPALSIFLTYETVRVAMATETLDSLSVTAVQKALQYDPGNPALVHRLGVIYSYVPTELNPSEAVNYLRQAAALNPRIWEYWTDLGTACDFAGDTSCSDEAFERARALNPVMPRLYWTIGNHYVLTNRVQMSFPYFRTLLDMAPEYAAQVVRLCLRAAEDPHQVYQGVIRQAKDPALRSYFLVFMSATGDYENAMKIWEEMIAESNRPPEIPSVKPFLDFLVDHDQISDATKVWNDLERRGGIPKVESTGSSSLVYNGSFDRKPLNTGFDWRYSDESDLLFDFADPSGYGIGKCLRIEFLVGRNADFDLLSQVVPVKPQTRYQLTAYVRSEDLTSDSGPRLRVTEMGCPNCPVSTSDQTLGTTKWHPVDLAFTTLPQTQAVRISFWRPSGRMPPRDISGTVWLDEVKLQAADLPGRTVTQERSR